MRFVFFGSPTFAAIVLEGLLAHGITLSALVCNPDRPVGRKHIITPPDTKRLIHERGLSIDVLQPEKLKEVESLLVALELDFFVVAAYAKIIPQSILDIPRLGTIGVHPSLLPKYRGASPIQSALLAGESMTGVTLYKLGAGVDDGPILAQQEIPIAEDDSYETLEQKLAKLGGEMLADLLPQFTKGEGQATPQNHSEATLTKKFKTEDGFVDETDLKMAESGAGLALALHNKIRALGTEPGVWTIKNGKRLKLLASDLEDNKLVLTEIQWEGKKPEKISRAE
jgi:methionyl-tRNA formyltransferase